MADETTPVVPVDDIPVFKLTRREKKIKIEDGNGDTKGYVIREMMGTDRDKWLNTMATRMKVDNKGNSLGVREFDGLQSSLISRCLYNESGALVLIEVISRYPASVQKSLFSLCEELNSLGDVKKAEETAKND